MKIRILKGTTIGALSVNPGEVHEVDQNTKVILVDHLKFAEVVSTASPAAPEAEAPKVEPKDKKKGK